MRAAILRRLPRLGEVAIDSSAASCSSSTAPARQLSALAYEVETLAAEPRLSPGSLAAQRLRQSGRTPGVLFSLPGEEQLLLSFDAKTVATQVLHLGRTGWACRLFDIEVAPSQPGGEPRRFRALGRQVHLTSTTDAVENVTLVHCPSERRVRVDVPLTVFGSEVCPGIKSGGRVNWIRRTIPCVARGDAVPTSFEVDISTLGMNDKLHFSDLAPPEGVQLAVKDLSLPIIKVQK